MPRIAEVGLTQKKKTKYPIERDEETRLHWLIKVRDINAQQLIFADESACYLNMRHDFARSPKGQPAIVKQTYRPEGKVNLLACMSLEGVVAPWLVEGGTVDTGVFTYYLEHLLLPELRAGQILVLDNYAVHKTEAVRDLLCERDCKVMFLPTYSPDLNPIELLFSKLKARLRQLAAASVDVLSLAIDQLLKSVRLDELMGWFRKAGYIVY